METGLLVSVGAVVAALVLGCLLLVLIGSTRRTRRSLESFRAVVGTLEARVDALSQDLAALQVRPLAASASPDYVITDAEGPAAAERGRLANPVMSPATSPATNRVLLSATLGEPLIKVMAFGHGLRRALEPATRSRIAFEIKREVKRARKQRRRDQRAARRQGNTGSHLVAGSQREADAAA